MGLMVTTFVRLCWELHK